MLARSFTQFIFESYRDPIVDFCLDILHKFMSRGKGFQDLPLDIQKCIRSNGQTDISRKLEKIYNQYTKDGDSFASFPNIVDVLSSETDPIEELADIIIEYRGDVMHSFSLQNRTHELTLTGNPQVMEEIYYRLQEIFNEGDKLVSYNNFNDYSEIVIILSEREVERIISKVHEY